MILYYWMLCSPGLLGYSVTPVALGIIPLAPALCGGLAPEGVGRGNWGGGLSLETCETKEEIALHTGPVVGTAASVISGSSLGHSSLSWKIKYVHSLIALLSYCPNWQCLCWYNPISVPGFCWDGWLNPSFTFIITLSSDFPPISLVFSS